MPLNEMLSCVNQTKYESWTHVQPNYSCFKAALKSAFSFFPFPLDKALIVEVRMRTNRPPHQSAARSNLVGSLTYSWRVAMAKGGETKAHLPNSICATRSRRKLLQSNSSLNTLLFSTRGYIQWTSLNLSELVYKPVLASTTASGTWLHNPTVCENIHG